MNLPCTVLIAAPDRLTGLKKRVGEATSEVLLFSDADALRALEVISQRRPSLVALDRLFAATSRGVALISRIQADPSLAQSEIRVVSHDSDYARVVSQPAPGASPSVEATQSAAPTTAPATTVAVPAAPLDRRGTRRMPRFMIAPETVVIVDGNPATLVDLSIVGAHVVTAGVLKPNQRVRLALVDEVGTQRIRGTVAWAKFEIPPGSGPRYRAGIAFADADPTAVDAYCSRHKVS